MPHDLQQQYLDWMYDEFRAGQKDMAKYVLRITPEQLCKNLKMLGLRTSVSRSCDVDRLQKWVNDDGYSSPQELFEAGVEAMKDPEVLYACMEDVLEKNDATASVCHYGSMRLELHNVHTWEEFYTMAKCIPLTGEGQHIEVTVG